MQKGLVAVVTALPGRPRTHPGERKGRAFRRERLTNGTRTFKIRKGEALPTSFGQDLYDDIFGGRYPREPISEARATGSGGRDDPSFSRLPPGPA